MKVTLTNAEMLSSVESLAEAKETGAIGLVSTQNINGYNVLTLAR